jgi:hypothetical protein
MRDLGRPVLYAVGIESAWVQAWCVSQANYVRRLAQYGMADASQAGADGNDDTGPLGRHTANIGEYRSLVGGLQWLTTARAGHRLWAMLGRYGAAPQSNTWHVECCVRPQNTGFNYSAGTSA